MCSDQESRALDLQDGLAGAEQCQVLRPEAPGLQGPPRSDIQGSGSLHQRPNGAIPGTHRQFQAAIISVLSTN